MLSGSAEKARRPRTSVSRTRPSNPLLPAYGLPAWRVYSLSDTPGASGDQTTRSASIPAAMRPLRAVSPARRAGPSDHQWDRLVSDQPRDAAAVHVACSEDCSPEMPAHAVRKSPEESARSSGAQGEWSLAMRSTMPSESPAHSPSRLAAPRIGGRHLRRVSPSGTY